MDRRRFLQIAAMAGLGTAVNPGDLLAQYRFLDPVRVPNPLQQYPNRDWERIYRSPRSRGDRPRCWWDPRRGTMRTRSTSRSRHHNASEPPSQPPLLEVDLPPVPAK